MLIAKYSPTTGWSAPEIRPYAPLSIDPASSCLQYCTNVFEGMKVQSPHFLLLRHVGSLLLAYGFVRRTWDPMGSLGFSDRTKIWSV